MSPVTAILTAASLPAMPRRPARPSLPFASPWPAAPSSGAALAVECSSRPQKKATKHHIKSRPKKTQPWDIRRRPTQYPPLPPLPPDWTLVAAGATVDASASASRPPPPSAVEVTAVAADDDAE